MIRTCKKCNAKKSLSDFPNYPFTTKDGQKGVRQRYTCRDCFNSNTRQWFKDNPTAKAKINVRNNYGLDWEEYQELMSRGCEVCGTLENLCIDHDHSCCPKPARSCGNCIRGVLCRGHNLAEGYCHSDPDEALRLAEYIIRTSRSGSQSSPI